MKLWPRLVSFLKDQKKSTGKGHAGKRKLNRISFHALRHTTTSLLKNAGVAASIVQEIVGHESSAMSDHYTHVDDGAKCEALAKLPTLQFDLKYMSLNLLRIEDSNPKSNDAQSFGERDSAF